MKYTYISLVREGYITKEVVDVIWADSEPEAERELELLCESRGQNILKNDLTVEREELTEKGYTVYFDNYLAYERALRDHGHIDECHWDDEHGGYIVLGYDSDGLCDGCGKPNSQCNCSGCPMDEGDPCIACGRCNIIET